MEFPSNYQREYFWSRVTGASIKCVVVAELINMRCPSKNSIGLPQNSDGKFQGYFKDHFIIFKDVETCILQN